MNHQTIRVYMIFRRKRALHTRCGTHKIRSRAHALTRNRILAVSQLTYFCIVPGGGDVVLYEHDDGGAYVMADT